MIPHPTPILPSSPGETALEGHWELKAEMTPGSTLIGQVYRQGWL